MLKILKTKKVILKIMIVCLFTESIQADAVSQARKAIKNGAYYNFIPHEFGTAAKFWPEFDCSGFIQYSFWKDDKLPSASKKMLSVKGFMKSKYFKEVPWNSRKRNDIIVIKNHTAWYHIVLVVDKFSIITAEDANVGIVEIPAWVPGKYRPKIPYRLERGLSSSNSYSPARGKKCKVFRYVR